MPIGLYIHVPFCLQKCLYCDFASYPIEQGQVEQYMRGLGQEIDYYRATLAPEQKQIATIFVGGGTPTCLMSGQLAGILEQVSRVFTIVTGAEITTEANPGTVTLASLRELRAAGFNRLSLGVQSTHRELLRVIGRIHDFDQARQAVHFARAAGFENLNLDLMFGLPTQTAARWRQSVSEIVNLQPDHVSCYSLQLEEGTPLTRAVDQGRLAACPEELELEMYRIVIEILGTAGYEHYEISNFARPGYRCRHNLLYWHNQEYLGLGPAAHSHLNQSRWGNVEDIDQYVSLLQAGQRPTEEIQSLSEGEQMEETVFLGLRLIPGVNLADFRQRFGIGLTEVFGRQVRELEKKGLVELVDGYLRLTGKGLPLANQVFAEFV
ncbi:coproporphyrinogen III oxidase [Desulforamulus profundi]|uniref:Heme chaperone HemW n=1 Tax=Desulforamulus profundi TaxID=1383067 RepID=A0A2C6MD67_9FIRM|nr:radical SAM family heme chaperone HemW [Desulforamulus profundi]PHJ37263.1 coproporphyrinogen III oxidase [Desulforamulus profundi]